MGSSKDSLPPAGWRHRVIAAASILLVVEIVAFYGFRRAERIPATRPLSGFPTEVSGWRMVQEIPLESDVEAFLKASIPDGVASWSPTRRESLCSQLFTRAALWKRPKPTPAGTCA